MASTSSSSKIEVVVVEEEVEEEEEEIKQEEEEEEGEVDEFKEQPRKFYVLNNRIAPEKCVKTCTITTTTTTTNKKKNKKNKKNVQKPKTRTKIIYPFSAVFENCDTDKDPELWKVMKQENKPTILVDAYTYYFLKHGNMEIRFKTSKVSGVHKGIECIMITRYIGDKMQTALSTCYHCGKPNPPELCSICKIARYCNKKCQIVDFNSKHKLHCVDLKGFVYKELESEEEWKIN